MVVILQNLNQPAGEHFLPLPTAVRGINIGKASFLVAQINVLPIDIKIDVKHIDLVSGDQLSGGDPFIIIQLNLQPE
jgi:hypothetical protein